MKKFICILITTNILLMLLLSFSCSSWKTNLKANIDQESKDYCLFAKDSYWVYQDSATLVTDKVFIFDVSCNKTNSASPTEPFLWEAYTMKTTCSLNDNFHSQGSYRLTSGDCEEGLVEQGIAKFIQLEYRNDIDLVYFDTIPANLSRIMYVNHHNGVLYESSFYAYFDGETFYENYYEVYQIDKKMTMFLQFAIYWI